MLFLFIYVIPAEAGMTLETKEYFQTYENKDDAAGQLEFRPGSISYFFPQPQSADADEKSDQADITRGKEDREF